MTDKQIIIEKDIYTLTKADLVEQLARKTQLSIEQSKELIRLRKKLQESTIKNRNLKQECEQIKEKYEALKLENEEGYEIVDELKHEYEELENKIKKLRKNLALEIEINDRYRKALEEIEEYIKKYECDNCEDYVFGCGDCGTPRDILDIINKAKDGD